MTEEARIVNHTLTFYIEHIATSGTFSNTTVKLVIIGEVTYNELKAHARERLGITEDFELDYTPSPNHAHLVAFQHTPSSVPCIWMYTVPLQEPGAAPWYLHDTRWGSLGPERQAPLNVPYYLNDQQQGTTGGEPRPDLHNYTYQDLLWLALPTVTNPAARQALQEIVDCAPRPQILNKWSYLRIAVIIILILLYLNWLMATFENMLDIPTISQLSVPVCLALIGYASARKIPYSPIVVARRIRRN